MSRWVVDASPLIFLAKLERLPLLRDAAGEVLVPQVVLSEIRAQEDPATSRIESACRSWLQPVASQAPTDADLVGELALIGLALEMDASRVVLDDLAARRQARECGLPVIGTLGILLAARHRGEISSLRTEIDRLVAHGFRVSSELVDRVLEEAGER